MDDWTDRIVWESDPKYLHELQGDLPSLTRLADSGMDLGPGIDTAAPFLLYSSRRRTKVVAELVSLDQKKKSKLVPCGSVCEIPKDYTGWFEVLSTDGKDSKPCSIIKEVIKYRQFLLLTSLHVFPFDDDDGAKLDEDVVLYPGEVVTVVGVINKQWKVVDSTTTSAASSIYGGSTNNNNSNGMTAASPQTKFLKCIDYNENVVCVPLAHPGKFSPVYDPALRGGNPPNAVYQICDLLERQFPLTVRLAYGWPPLGNMGLQFTGLLQLSRIRKPDTLVMCNIKDGQLPLLEVPIDIKMKVFPPSNLDTMKKDRDFLRLVKKCYEKVYQYVICLKPLVVKYPLIEKYRGKDHKYFALPVDMEQFNPYDVYPHFDVSESEQMRRLSFRDPEDFTPNAALGHLREVEYAMGQIEVVTEPRSGPRTTGSVRSKLQKLRVKYAEMMKERESVA